MSTGIVLAAVVVPEARIEEGDAAGQRQIGRRRPLEFALQPTNARIAGIFDDGHAVEAQEGELKVLPVFLENGAVPSQMMIEPLRLPAHFIVGQEVRLVGTDARLRRTIDAARTKALRPGRIHHLVLVDLVRQVDLGYMAFIGGAIAQVLTGCSHHDGRREALGHA